MEGKEFGGPSPEEMGINSSLNNKEEGMDMGQQEKIKSPEEQRFDELVKDARHRSLEGNYAFVDTKEEAQAVHEESMKGAYLESGDPEKMAMFNLQELQIDLGSLAMSLDTLAKWDERQQRRSVLERAKIFALGWKKSWEKSRDTKIEKLGPILSELGIEIPQTAEEVMALKKNIVSFENSQKLAKKYKDQQEGAK